MIIKRSCLDKRRTNMHYSANASIEAKTAATPKIKAYTFPEDEDGWGTEVRSILDLSFAHAEALMYEIRNTIRGAYTDCKTVEELAEFIRELASEFEEAANEIEDM